MSCGDLDMHSGLSRMDVMPLIISLLSPGEIVLQVEANAITSSMVVVVEGVSVVPDTGGVCPAGVDTVGACRAGDDTGVRMAGAAGGRG